MIATMRSIAFLIVLSVVAGACDGHRSPTEPLRCGTATVFASEAWYQERAEAETEVSGRLERRDVLPSPNGRDHRYFLNGTAVYSGGASTEPIFNRASGWSVIIRGKVADVGYGPEIWSATITSCR